MIILLILTYNVFLKYKFTQICSGFTANFTLFFDYTYNGKEKDYESGFHYYGSRYYSSELSIWNSTDPMSDKYPSLTPYNYCANNPVKLIDPNGKEIVDADGNTMYKDGKWTNYATKEAKK
ncbi:MAG: RHS repeat-associated core domain-containing protein [Bacteroidales bacterium]|nr:RHS repeat-associated core domain-containing protein [Bacteroidales bacterium]